MLQVWLLSIEYIHRMSFIGFNLVKNRWFLRKDLKRAVQDEE